jgi:hypothetical protein
LNVVDHFSRRAVGFAVFKNRPTSEDVTAALDRIIERGLATIPEEQSRYEQEALIIDWYNEHRPHNTLDGKTPNEVYFFRQAANQQPRYEPRERWPRGSLCARPQAEVAGEPGDPIVLEIDCLEGRRHLPIIRTRLAA